ncbi:MULTISPECIES: hypothetical protein [Rhodococcus]|uniref:putative phage holin n=1 Tax=Rhodococcus TaxID=1827 RepID=UPI002953FC37|nr:MULTISPECIES: hypothetical protein [Rhodococcus]MDV7244466.1 hypothetical protein [Rhodococcus oxybenzonivorans]MDV7274291.1 hypothetical protein [Rhodococcus oxybenzonivorans]MDV7337823.1 hypothetical protein [Rhodococcus oxybenzonivorans]MDV7345241.1 hypothetical protein [Rhodococcus oxybenzonivorans]MDV8028929.1 hypothetical protein [Rhodococcus sp. IEGM 27]
MRVNMILAFLLGLVVISVYDAETEARILITSMTVLAWTFSILYATRSNWRVTQAGKALMYTSAALALLGTQIMSVWWLGNYPYRTEIRDVVLLLLVLTVLYRILVLLKIQEREHTERKRL